MNLHNVFGVNVYDMFMDWFDREFTEMFNQRFPDKGITLVILDSDDIVELERNWKFPLALGNVMIVVHVGDEEAAKADNGTLQNVEGKLRFVLRTGRNSVEAETQQDLVRPGDFPWEGAGNHKGYIGGVSGLAKEEDTEMLRICIEKLRELLMGVNSAAMVISDNLRKRDVVPVGAKYLYEIDASEAFPEYAVLE